MADAVHVGYSEVRIAMNGKKPPKRPWTYGHAARTPTQMKQASQHLADVARRSGRSELAPIDGRAPDSPWDGTNVGAEIARQRAAIIAASRMN